eukprot:gene2896-4739_t
MLVVDEQRKQIFDDSIENIFNIKESMFHLKKHEELFIESLTGHVISVEIQKQILSTSKKIEEFSENINFIEKVSNGLMRNEKELNLKSHDEYKSLIETNLKFFEKKQQDRLTLKFEPFFKKIQKKKNMYELLNNKYEMIQSEIFNYLEKFNHLNKIEKNDNNEIFDIILFYEKQFEKLVEYLFKSNSNLLKDYHFFEMFFKSNEHLNKLIQMISSFNSTIMSTTKLLPQNFKETLNFDLKMIDEENEEEIFLKENNELLDHKNEEYLNHLLNILPQNYILNSKIFVNNHFQLSKLVQYSYLEKSNFLFENISKSFNKMIITKESKDFKMIIKAKQIINEASIISNEFVIQKNFKLKVLNKYKSFIVSYLNELKPYRMQIIIFEYFCIKLKRNSTKNSILFKNLNLKLILLIKKVLKESIFKKVLLNKIINNFKIGDFKKSRNLLKLERFPIYIENLITKKIQWKSFHFSKFNNFNDADEQIDVLFSTKTDSLNEKKDENMFTNNIAPSRISLYLKNKDEKLLNNEDDLIKDLKEKIEEFIEPKLKKKNILISHFNNTSNVYSKLFPFCQSINEEVSKIQSFSNKIIDNAFEKVNEVLKMKEYNIPFEYLKQSNLFNSYMIDVLNEDDEELKLKLLKEYNHPLDINLSLKIKELNEKFENEDISIIELMNEKYIQFSLVYKKYEKIQREFLIKTIKEDVRNISEDSGVLFCHQISMFISNVPSFKFEEFYLKYSNLISLILPKLVSLRKVYLAPLKTELHKLKKRKRLFELIESFNSNINLHDQILNPMTHLICFKMVGKEEMIPKLINLSKYLDLSLNIGFMEDLNENMVKSRFESENHWINEESIDEIIDIWFKNDTAHQNMKKCCSFFERVINENLK